MSEKETLLNSWEREYQLTTKVFKAFPEGKLDFKPHELSRTAKELAKERFSTCQIGWWTRAIPRQRAVPSS